MSRVLLACSLIGALTTSAMAQSFAKPPASETPAASEVYEPDLRVAPSRVLDRDAVRAKLIENRATNVANFRAYVKRGVFPSNTYKDGKLNVWIDAAGNMCAAATMINDSGLHGLVMRVGDQNNFIRLLDVKTGPLMNWMLMSGLTKAEIVAIQEPGFMVRQQPRGAEGSLADPRRREAPQGRGRSPRAPLQASRRDDRKERQQSLEAAVDRLMKNQALAWALVNG